MKLIGKFWPRIVLIVLMMSAAALSQAGRFDAPADTTISVAGVPNLVVTVPAPTVAVYVYPGPTTNCNTSSCTKATTYTDSTAATPCATTSQITTVGSNICTAVGDQLGNFGFWALPGKYQYCVSGAGATGQCYNIVIAPDITASIPLTGDVTCKKFEKIRCVDSANAAVWSGSDMGAWLNSADADLGATYGEIWLVGGGTMTTQPTPRSGHTYRFFPGTYNFPAPFLFSSLKDFKIICEPGCVLNNQQTAYNGGDATVASLIRVDSGTPTFTSALSGNGTVGATSVTVTSGTGFAAGQQIAIFDTRFAEVNQIASSYAGGTTVTLVHPLENTYTTARGAQANTYNWASNFLIRGVVATGVNSPSAGSGAAVILKDALDGNVEDLTCTSGAGRCYLASGLSSRTHAFNIHASNPSDNSIENYITSSHNIIQNCWATGSTKNGIALHGFHETLYNCHSWGNTLSGLQIDSGQFLNVIGGEFDANVTQGITVSGGSLNTTEATDVSITGVQVEDNAGDGLSAGTGGNVRLNVTGGVFIRNRGSHGGFYLNALAPGSNIAPTNVWGNTNNGIAFDGASTTLSIGPTNFQGPTANGVADINLIGTVDFSTLYGAGSYSVAGNAFGTNATVIGGRQPWQMATGIGPFALNGNGLSGVTSFGTNTNCAGVGTAASPSVASCGAAIAGHFSCATNATGATCQVNTSAVTANSEILVFESDTAATGTALGVTCNTSTNVLPTSRLLASSVTSTSFTINLGTVTTNPACFSYYIIN